MNKPALFFAGTTVLFAASTVYFAWQPDHRDTPQAVEARADRYTAAPSSGLPVAAAGGSPASNTPIAARGNAAPAAAAATAAAPKAAASEEARRGIMLPFARDFMRQYDDLALRGALLASARKGFESQYALLRDRLKLDAATFDQLTSLLAEESLEQQANYFRCVVDPSCNLANVPTPRDRGDEIQALLGPEGHAQFTSFRDAMPEWQSVVQLRGRLSESQSLRDGDAERLRTAMTDARKRFTGDLEQQGAQLRGWSNGTGSLWYSGDGTTEQQLASAMQYSQMMRRQAAALLNGEQLRLFTQLQDELLASFGAYLQQAQADRG